MLEEDKTIDRLNRHKVTQEDFTPLSVADPMLDTFGEDAFSDLSEDNNFLDPSCGIGNFMVNILNRRLKHCRTTDDALKALTSIYGIELMADNVEVCRQRLFDTITGWREEMGMDPALRAKVRHIIKNRVVWHDALEFMTNPSKDFVAIDLSYQPTEDADFHENEVMGMDTYPMWTKPKPSTQHLF